MMKKMHPLVAIVASLLVSSGAFSQTHVPLNTGYNHSPLVQAAYAPPSSSTSNVRDDYWINIASFPPTGPPVDRAFVLRSVFPPWVAAMPDTNWISARNTMASAPSTSSEVPAYTIFRKCFCLSPGFHDAKLNFDVRADDTIQIWFNSQMNQLLPPSWGHWDIQPTLRGGTSDPRWFRTGKNCIYVLVEDFGGHMGFDLKGDFSAYGLLPTPAKGVEQSFEPCACRPSGPVGAAEAASTKRIDDDEKQVIDAIRKIAADRGKARQLRQYQGETPKLEVSPGPINPRLKN
jgi:hypothetical protein